jgi:hypothetical protein
VHGGYAGVSDDVLLGIPYARLLQAVRLASENAVDAARERYRTAAFVGWQLRAAVAGAFGGGSKTPSFGRYLRQLGLDQAPAPRANHARASANVGRVRAAFAAGRMRRSVTPPEPEKASSAR